MIWAIETTQGYNIRYCDQHPKDAGHSDECTNTRVVKLPYEPMHDVESIDFEEGKITFNPNFSNFIGLVKQKASQEIDRVAPLWRQLNDLANTNSDGSLRQAIDNIRHWSNSIESRLIKTSTKEELLALVEEIKEFKYEIL